MGSSHSKTTEPIELRYERLQRMHRTLAESVEAKNMIINEQRKRLMTITSKQESFPGAGRGRGTEPPRPAVPASPGTRKGSVNETATVFNRAHSAGCTGTMDDDDGERPVLVCTCAVCRCRFVPDSDDDVECDVCTECCRARVISEGVPALQLLRAGPARRSRTPGPPPTRRGLSMGGGGRQYKWRP
jgi:hypothetical protein